MILFTLYYAVENRGDKVIYHLFIFFYLSGYYWCYYHHYHHHLKKIYNIIFLISNIFF